MRRAAQVALTNLTGMEFPLNSLAPANQRDAQVEVWRDWWAVVPADRPPDDVLKYPGVGREPDRIGAKPHVS